MSSSQKRRLVVVLSLVVLALGYQISHADSSRDAAAESSTR
ncbi:MAG: hypothetical protein AB7O24_04130 [Kofleriaceae bacterium]